MRRLLLVDDEPNVLSALQRTIRQCGFGEEDSVEADDAVRVETFTNPLHALERAREIAFDAVIVDFRMPQMNGVDFLRDYKEIQADSVRMILSASTEFETLMSAINQAEVFRYLTKPWQQSEIKEVITLAFAYRDEQRENLRLFNELRDQMGELSPQEREAQKLEQEEPGITKVNWGPDGSVQLD